MIDNENAANENNDVVVTESVAKPKGKVFIKLADGTVRERTKGRQPINSFVVDPVTGIALSEPVKSKALEKPKNFMLCPDGTVKPRSRGKLPLGHIAITK